MTDPYSTLGKFVLDTFFADDKRGEVIFPIIDEYYIKQFCKVKKCSIKDFFDSVHSCQRFFNISGCSSIEEILGIIAIQMYAASKMDTADGFSSSNFRNRICDNDVLDIKVNDWQKWACENQDDIWARYYEWCNDKSFIITNVCEPTIGIYRYVQYPKVHSSLILNRQDLKSIAYLFIEKCLNPNEDLSEHEFWSLIGIRHEKSYYSRRAIRILSEDRSRANEQIYQYFLSWTGKYLKPTCYGVSEESIVSEPKYNINLYYDNENWFIDVLSIYNGELVEEIQLKSGLNFDFLKPYYNMKRNNVIVFQKDPDYGNWWNETRYIDDYNADALLLEYVGNGARYLGRNVVASIGLFRIIRINPKYELYEKFYGEERPYSIVGGFKLRPNTYIVGAPPILITKVALAFWIDGVRYDSHTEQQTHTFDFKKGKHQIKIKGYKAKEFTLVEDNIDIIPWNDNKRWDLQNKRPYCWQTTKEGLVVGLDFSKYSYISTITPLRKWCSDILYRKNNINYLIKEKNKYGNRKY